MWAFARPIARWMADQITRAADRTREEPMETIVGYCDYCEDSTAFSHIAIHMVNEEPPCEYTFCKCSKCERPAVFLREDVGEGFEADSFWRMFPKQERHIGFALPTVVRGSYDEAVKCEEAKAWTATAAMVGRALEAVCRDYDPTTKTIHEGLKRMLTNGAISQEISDWANALRVIRNVAAHATTASVSRQDAVEALDFLQSILEILYDLRPRFMKMKARHGP